MRRVLLAATLVLASCMRCASGVESFPYRACVYDMQQRWQTGSVIDKREDGARLFRYDDRTAGDLGYMWISADDPAHRIARCEAANALAISAEDASPRR